MASTITPATLTVTHTETITLKGQQQGTTNIISIPSIATISKRIIDDVA